MCKTHSDDEVRDARQRILHCLSDGKPHLLTELNALHLSADILSLAVGQLVREEGVQCDTIHIQR